MICEFNISSTADTESTPTLRSDDIMNRLREERDEARRMLCLTEAAVLSFGPDGVPYHPSVAHKIAEDYGWDCFKEKEEADANNDEFRKNYR